MQIECKVNFQNPSPKDCTLPLEVEESDTVRSVKEQIYDKIGRPVGEQQLFFAGEPMIDNKRLAEYSVKRGSKIHLVLSLKRPRVLDSAEPSEIVRFQDNFARICDGITNPEMFAARLFSAHLITDEVRQQADLPCFTPCCRVIKLVSAVLAQIKINPSESLRKFIAVLREDPCYESLAAKLDTKNGYQQTYMDDCPPLTDQETKGISPVQEYALPLLSVEEVEKSMKYFQDRFEDITFELELEFQEKIEGKVVSLERVRHSITHLPPEIRSEHYKFLQEKMKDLRRCDDIVDVFSHLNLYWTYIDYSLLERLVNKYASDKLQGDMEEYVRDMQSFRKQTLVSTFVTVWKGRAKPPPNTFTEIKAELKKDASHCTLEELNQLLKDFCAAFHLSESALMLYRLDPGSVIITWLIPMELVKKLMSTVKRIPIEIFCVCQNLRSVVVGVDKVYQEIEELAVPGQRSLKSLVDERCSECLNEMDSHPYTHALKPGPMQYLESDCDQQLLISLSFRRPVKLHSLQLTGPIDGHAPKTVRLFINQVQTLGFDQAQESKPVQELTLTEVDVGEESVIPLNYTKYQNVHNLTIFVKDNQGEQETTVVHHIGLYGNYVEAIDMSQFQRVAGEEGEEHVHAHQFHCP